MLKDKVALVTGAGRGIGRGVALALAEAGAKVVVNDYGVATDGSEPTSGPAFDVVAEIERAGGTAVANTDSVATWDGGEKMVRQAVDGFGRIDIVVTCAGILRDRMIYNMTPEEWQAVIAVHLKGTFTCVRHAAPVMREQRYGRIITFSSGSGLFGNPGQANYGAAKSGIGGFTKVIAKDLGKYGVTANAIAPVAATRMTMTPALARARDLRRQQGIDERRRLNRLEDLAPEDVAPMVVFLASERAAHVNGQFFSCAGGSISLLSLPRAAKTLWKQGRWTLDELDELVPLSLAEGLVNPAPARPDEK
jgi:NAD(P)-dependent dehydrogenase (short-subunit alcohol dehydrogenase family)